MEHNSSYVNDIKREINDMKSADLVTLRTISMNRQQMNSTILNQDYT